MEFNWYYIGIQLTLDVYPICFQLTFHWHLIGIQLEPIEIPLVVNQHVVSQWGSLSSLVQLGCQSIGTLASDW